MGISVKKIIKKPCGINFYRSIACCFNSGFIIQLPPGIQITPVCKPSSKYINYLPYSIFINYHYLRRAAFTVNSAVFGVYLFFE